MPDSKGEINSIAARRGGLAVGEPGRRGGVLTVPAMHLGKMIGIRMAETLYQTIVYRWTFFSLCGASTTLRNSLDASPFSLRSKGRKEYIAQRKGKVAHVYRTPRRPTFSQCKAPPRNKRSP